MVSGETIMQAPDMDRALTRITHEILETHSGGDDLVIIGIRTRGVYLARRIVAKICETEGLEVLSGELDINLYRDDWTSIASQPVVQSTEIPVDLDGKKVVLVDDVLFTGRTIRAALEALMDFGRPDRIELAVLIDRGHRELPISADYVGKNVETRHQERVNVYLQEYDEREGVVLE